MIHGKTRQQSAARNEADGMCTHTAYEVTTQHGEDDEKRPVLSFISIAVCVRLVVAFRLKVSAAVTKDVMKNGDTIAYLDNNDLFEIAELRVDTLFCCPAVPTAFQESVARHSNHSVAWNWKLICVWW